MKTSKFNDIFNSFMIFEENDTVNPSIDVKEDQPSDNTSVDSTSTDVDEVVKKAAEAGFKFLKDVKKLDTVEKRKPVIEAAMEKDPKGDAAELVKIIKTELGETVDDSSQQPNNDLDIGHNTDEETAKRLEAAEDPNSKTLSSDSDEERLMFKK